MANKMDRILLRKKASGSVEMRGWTNLYLKGQKKMAGVLD